MQKSKKDNKKKTCPECKKEMKLDPDHMSANPNVPSEGWLCKNDNCIIVEVTVFV